MKEGFKRLCLYLILVLACSLPKLQAQTYAVCDVPNVQLLDSTRFTSDPNHFLSEQERAGLDLQLQSIRQQYNVDFAVVLLPNLGEANLETFAHELFQNWGLGQKDKDTGLLLLILPNHARLRFETGYGLEGILPDAFLGRVIRNDLAPHFRKKHFGLGISTAISSIANRLEQHKEELLTGRTLRPHRQKKSQGISAQVFLGFYTLFVLFVYISLCIELYLAIKKIKNSHTARKTFTTNSLKLKRTKLIIAFLFLPFISILIKGLVLGFSLIALAYFLPILSLSQWYSLRLKKSAEHCPNCAVKAMKSMPQRLHNVLTQAQKHEEKIGSKEFAFFHCQHCAYEEFTEHLTNPRIYQQCPVCQTLALKPVKKEHFQVRGIYYLRTTSYCSYCHHISNDDEEDKNPRNGNIGGNLLTALLLGSLLRGGGRGGFSGGGGGFSGGSFGGGASGGGGASASW